jgi:hypothetical protein
MIRSEVGTGPQGRWRVSPVVLSKHGTTEIDILFWRQRNAESLG